MTWLTAKGLKPKILHDFPHIFARHNVQRIRNYVLRVEHIDPYQGWIKYNCQGPMLTAGIKDKVMQFVRAISVADLGSLSVQLMDGNPILKDLRRGTTAQRVERGKNVASMQEVLEPLMLLHASFVEISGALLPEYATRLKRAILQEPRVRDVVMASVAPNIEPAVLWRWQMNWNA
ncbi:hypothetical protein, variant [Verruconis gallopava]|nr:hypothetical protein, variant [Verruconis gallopava]KIW09530.1 hypothetical protein, variant [Verruconis gallopava]